MDTFSDVLSTWGLYDGHFLWCSLHIGVLRWTFSVFSPYGGITVVSIWDVLSKYRLYEKQFLWWSLQIHHLQMISEGVISYVGTIASSATFSLEYICYCNLYNYVILWNFPSLVLCKILLLTGEP